MYGLDVRDERALQALLAERLGTFYEAARGSLSLDRGQKVDASAAVRCRSNAAGAAAEAGSRPPTLFDLPGMAAPEEAMWLEVKVAYQFREGGVRHVDTGANGGMPSSMT